MRVLIFSPRQCWPANTGARLREYWLARELSRHAELTLLAFDAPGADEQQRSEALSFYRSVTRVPAPRRYTPAKLIRGLLGRTPLPMLNYATNEMRNALARTLAAERFDIVQFEANSLAGYMDIVHAASKRPLIIYDWHNIESELMLRYSSVERSLAKRWYAALTVRKLARAEASMLKEGDGHIVCSRREQEQLLRIAPSARISVIPNGVDVEYFSDAALPQGQPPGRPRIVFTGSMDYHANIEAVMHFVHRLWPAVREVVPDAVFTIVGTNPRPQVRALAGPDVEVTGTVPDVRPYYRDAFAVVVPILTGGGTRLKILEAMAAGRPVVSTAVGAEGIAVAAGRNILLAETVEQWRQAFRLLVGNPHQRCALIENGRELVRSQYDWRGLGKALYEQYADWLNSRVEQ